MFNPRRVSATTLLVAATVAFGAGCQQQKLNHAENFEPPIEARQTTQLLDTQKAGGARDEATLYRAHFDASGLSSLGTSKLDLMLADSHRMSPLVVYVAIPADVNARARKAAVARYLMDHGLKADQIRLVDGPNPDTYTPAAVGLKNYDKTDTGSSESSGTSGTSSSGASSSSGMSSSGH
ncbi:MAG: hypothetical protein ABR964_06820 [Tepidisphaeraceae bacterium]